jgi:pimeloyl-ACP methyl ester carboxylesterase
MQNKPLLVFIPGTLCTSEMFLPIIDELNCDSVLIDFDQHNSLEAMSNQVLSTVGNRAFIPVGFSMGGMVAFELMRMVPEQLQGLILLNSNAHGDTPTRKESREKHLEFAKKNGLKSLIQQVYLPVYFSNTDCTHCHSVMDMAEKLGLDVFEAQLQVLAARPDSFDVLAANTKPTLIVGADNDLPCPPNQQRLMADSSQSAELHILPNCGHFAPLEQPKKIANIINLWINKHYA